RRRTRSSASLPDCRGYTLDTPSRTYYVAESWKLNTMPVLSATFALATARRKITSTMDDNTSRHLLVPSGRGSRVCVSAALHQRPRQRGHRLRQCGFDLSVSNRRSDCRSLRHVLQGAARRAIVP